MINSMTREEMNEMLVKTFAMALPIGEKERDGFLFGARVALMTERLAYADSEVKEIDQILEEGLKEGERLEKLFGNR